MGTPSDGKAFEPDQNCPDCGDIMIGDEIEEGRCRECQLIIAADIALTSGQEHLLPLDEEE